MAAPTNWIGRQHFSRRLSSTLQCGISSAFGCRNFGSSSSRKKLPVCWLDLRGSGLSILERLCLEECLLHTDDRFWVIAGHHEATEHKYLKLALQTPRYIQQADSHVINPTAMIVMGIGGKPEKLLNLDLVKEEGVWTVKRFSGGGTVVIDYNCIWTTVIAGRSSDDPLCPAYPRDIMKWSVDLFAPLVQELDQMHSLASKEPDSKHTLAYSLQDASGISSGNKNPQTGPVWNTLVMDNKSCCGLDQTGRTLTVPQRKDADDSPSLCGSSSLRSNDPSLYLDASAFALQEHDYAMGDLKIAGNAQAIVKQGWLHHTSWLWDFDPENMKYLTLPDKRPDYRKDRDHGDFLTSLTKVYPKLKKNDFYGALKNVCEQIFDMQNINPREAMALVEAKGGIATWFQKHSRNQIIKEL